MTNRSFPEKLFHLGLSDKLTAYLYAQGYVFNMLNTAGLLLSLVRFIYILLFSPLQYSSSVIAVNTAPVLACTIMMWLMKIRAYKTTVYFSFLIFPLLILAVSLYTHDRGMLFFLVPYFIYPFFFLNSKKKIIPVFFSVVLIFMAGVAIEIYGNPGPLPQVHDLRLEIISSAGAMVLTFISLFSIKYQVWNYQEKIRTQKAELKAKNDEIHRQREKLEESNRIKDKLFSIIGHDLKAPLQGLSFLMDGTRSGVSDDTLREILPELRRELKKTNELFEQLVSWAKIQLKDSKVLKDDIDIGRLVQKVSEGLEKRAKDKGVLIKNELNTGSIVGDPAILEIVLRNLVSNAIKFSNENGSVTVSGKTAQNGYEIIIEDGGIGMSPDILEKIKSKNFYTTNGTNGEKGTGLGLIICSDLVERSGGKLSIKSVKGRGTAISIALPQ